VSAFLVKRSQIVVHRIEFILNSGTLAGELADGLVKTGEFFGLVLDIRLLGGLPNGVFLGILLARSAAIYSAATISVMPLVLLGQILDELEGLSLGEVTAAGELHG